MIAPGIVKKKIVAVFLAALLVFVAAFALGACQEREPEQDPNLNYDFSVYFGASLDAISAEELVEGFGQETGLKVRAITESDSNKSEKTLLRELRSTQPPAAYMISVETDVDYLTEKLYLAPDGSGTGARLWPFEVSAKGLVVDRKLISEWCGEDKTDSFLSDLSGCSGPEWLAFTEAADLYITKSKVATFSLSGSEYTFPKKKGALTSELNGVFAIPGGEPLDFINMLVENAYYAAPYNEPSFEAIAEGMAELTSSLAGKYAPALRGNDFGKIDYFSVRDAIEIFALSRAIFAPMGTGDYNEITALDSEKAERLAFVPLKLAALGNDKIQVSKKYSFALNLEVPEYAEDATAFIEFAQKNGRSYLNALSNSATDQVNAGRGYETDGFVETLDDFESELQKDAELALYLTTRNLDEEKSDAFAEHIYSLWPNVDEIE